MLSWTECLYCGDVLHSFLEELEDGSRLHVVVCPTCYQTIVYSRVSSKQVESGQQVEGIMSTS
jgi:hypothetical protein